MFSRRQTKVNERLEGVPLPTLVYYFFYNVTGIFIRLLFLRKIILRTEVPHSPTAEFCSFTLDKIDNPRATVYYT
ncbi:hypothetical protein PDIG_62070 [Penicillium digitatum PHI26]|uniref:Uncharacterized protein n=2 Tax=Penicillium digitatum TaxID=36651 RepID=K9G3P5_PEND2|nr:hypothetical protein PDIP_71460 [Penicillium digitatum Pd1]EKV07866.1 hypothetical protein PDIP_71460 [Penicillium digitatum Pd1]EKV09453.1 hypothetical protein PDIG_62070 [Penicillium digitatum PHI26]